MAWTPENILGYHSYAKDYISGYGTKIDCADLAIACLIDYADKNSLKISLKYYSNEWQWLHFPEQGTATNAFKRKAMRMLGALNLIDNSIPIPLPAAKSGDLIMTKWSSSLGHTRVVYSIAAIPDSADFEVVWYQGNLPPVVPQKRTGKFSEIDKVFGGSPRRWRFEQFG